MEFGGKHIKWHSAVCFVLSLDFYFSGNKLHQPKMNYKEGYAVKRKAPMATALQIDIAQQIADMGLENSGPKNCFGYICEALFLFGRDDWLTKKGDLRVIDLTNLWKVVEDGIFQGCSKAYLEGIGVDDSKCIELYLRKGFIDCKTPPYLVACRIDFYVPA